MLLQGCSEAGVPSLLREEVEEGGRAAAAADSAVPRYVVVCRGDSLWAIARSSGSTVEQLLALNPSIKNPNLIYAGQKVRVA